MVLRINKDKLEVAAAVARPIRLITKRSFMQRLDFDERTAIRNSDDPVVLDFREDLEMASNVDLDLQDVRNALHYMVHTMNPPLLVEDRIAEILVDGTASEEYKGA